MDSLLQKLRASPAAPRALPFLIFAAFTTLQGKLGPHSAYWLYFAKSVLGAGMVLLIWPRVKELRCTISLEAVLAGAGVIVLWIGLDPFYPKIPGFSPAPNSWNPPAAFGEGSALANFFIVARIAGATLVVPPVEEVFYRSFVYRYVIRAEFETVPLKRFHAVSFVVTSAIFALSHREWLAGLLCGFAYQWLVLRRGHLGDAVTAHAISNLLLGLWVVYKGAWQFW